jgi:hypothetical protein
MALTSGEIPEAWLAATAEMFPGTKCMAKGNGGCRDPEMNLGNAVAMFLDVGADHAFAERERLRTRWCWRRQDQV